jgi:glycosyltransferase involved in cell wall biosynthesis
MAYCTKGSINKTKTPTGSHNRVSAAELARGEFIALLDHDDLLSPDCLGEVALHIAAHPNVDVLYTDDDKIDMNGRRYGPQFKPDWSPESLLSQMYFSHLFVIRRSLYERVGGMREGFEGSQDHDLALRAVEHAREIAHLPLVLYHWRASPGSTASTGLNDHLMALRCEFAH